LNRLEALSEELRRADEPLEVHTAVFDREALVIEEQLFLSVENDVLGIEFVDALLQSVALDLEGIALLSARGAAQGIGLVPVGDAEHLEWTVTGQSDLGGINGCVEVFEHNGGEAGGQFDFGNALYLRALLVDHDVVDGGGDGEVAVFGFVVRRPTQG